MAYPPPPLFPLERAFGRLWLPAELKREGGFTHGLLVEQVCNAGEACGYLPLREWPVKPSTWRVFGRVDVVLITKASRLAPLLAHVVEVDSSARKKSIEKLLAFGPSIGKWWVFYGKQRPTVPPEIHVVMVGRRPVDHGELEGRGSRERGAISSPFQNGRPENSRTAGSSLRTAARYKKEHATVSSEADASRSEAEGGFR